MKVPQRGAWNLAHVPRANKQPIPCLNLPKALFWGWVLPQKHNLMESLTKFLLLCLVFLLFLSPDYSVSLTLKPRLIFLCIYRFPCKSWVQKEFRVKHCSERAVGKKLHMQQNMLELCFDSFMTKPKNIRSFCTWRSFTKTSPRGIVIFLSESTVYLLKTLQVLPYIRSRVAEG